MQQNRTDILIKHCKSLFISLFIPICRIFSSLFREHKIQKKSPANSDIKRFIDFIYDCIVGALVVVAVIYLVVVGTLLRTLSVSAMIKIITRHVNEEKIEIRISLLFRMKSDYSSNVFFVKK